MFFYSHEISWMEISFRHAERLLTIFIFVTLSKIYFSNILEYSMYFWNHVPGMQLIRPNGSAIILELSSLSIRDGFTYPRSSFICDEFNCDDAMARPRRSTSLMELKRTFLNYKLKKKTNFIIILIISIFINDKFILILLN